MIIEVVVIQYLKNVLNVPCYAEMPELDKTGPYIVVEKTGASSKDFISGADFVIQCYEDTLYKAIQLCESVKRAMQDIVNETNISRASLNSDYNATDPDTKKYRYQCYYNMTYLD